MASKFADFLKQNKIDGRRLLSTSQQIERLRREDRQLRLQKKQKAGSDAKPDPDQPPPAKPRSGRPITPRLLAAATAGQTVSGPGKTRLLRAVNRVLEQRKQDAIDLRALF